MGELQRSLEQIVADLDKNKDNLSVLDLIIKDIEQFGNFFKNDH